MKSDDEIQEWIDRRDVTTQRELMTFIYGYYSGKRHKLFCKWWLYVIETKDLVKLNEYRESRINVAFNVKLFERIKEIYNKDPRIKEVGVKSGTKLLNSLYGITIPKSTYRTYLKRIKHELV